MSNELAVVDGQSYAIMPVMAMEQALQRRQMVVDFTKRIMVDGTDYGAIPGTGDKPTLLKPGAEKLTSFFGLAPRFITEEKELDWTGERHNGEAFFHFQYRCQLYRGEQMVGEGLGSCNSWEKKYRWRTASPTCPECDQETIKRSKYPPRNNPNGKPGWYCFAKIGGCGANFEYEDESILRQETGRVPNDNPADLVNTIDKMAQKRALVAATLIAVNASEFFTQDIEDMDFGPIEGEYKEVKNRNGSNPPAGNGKPPQAGPEEARDLVEEGRAKARHSGASFIPGVALATGWSEDEVRDIANALGFKTIEKKPAGRVKQFNTMLEYRELEKAGIEGSLALGVINGVITRAEAEAQLAVDAGDEEE